MSNHVFKMTEIVGVSDKGFDDAITGALGRAGETLRNITRFEVAGMRGTIAPKAGVQFEATVKIYFEIEPPPVEPPFNIDLL